MTPNEKIVAAAYAVLRGEVHVPARSGMCLALVRTVVEHALYDGRWCWYDLHRTHEATGKPAGLDPWARDMERSLRAAGQYLALPRRGPPGDPSRYVDLDASSDRLRPGDLLFRWDTALVDGHFIGHVGVLMPGGLVLENVDPEYRSAYAGVWRGPTRLTPLGVWPVTTVIRVSA